MYNKIAEVMLTNKRSVVISECSKGGFTIAQKVSVDDNGMETEVFMKGAIIVNDLSLLKDLRKAIDIAISKSERRSKREKEIRNWIR